MAQTPATVHQINVWLSRIGRTQKRTFECAWVELRLIDFVVCYLTAATERSARDLLLIQNISIFQIIQSSWTYIHCTIDR